ncbi:hypothetical protein [Synoicihabitans lomoniglobus]|uniref:Uncharacterized protein n=1 Tax=Synoicihabitans lomoniglobus TaxID=2909285 RepID=A0AAF0I553_9BACT|nr:hypothetical protein [Opitutaceae bacterium LMO-M01]WED66855.1 hypothetical protein PXH66_08330 [Opitutaceae bacterium LMO-M01]
MSIHVGIIGPSLFGKSHVGKRLSLTYWQRERRRSIVFDTRSANWGNHSLVFTDKAKFLEACWRYRSCAVFCDDFGDHFERDKEVTPMFTSLRHQFHQLHAMTHVWQDMLPKQRNQLGTLFLFWQTRESAESIAREWSDSRLLESTRLPKYEFLHCRKHADAPNHIITRGRFPA